MMLHNNNLSLLQIVLKIIFCQVDPWTDSADRTPERGFGGHVRFALPYKEEDRTMRRTATFTLLAATLLCSAAAAQHPDAAQYQRPNYAEPRLFTGSMQVGYFHGANVHFAGTFDNFAGGFPFAVRFGVGHAWSAAGDALLARRVFIDNNTNGTPKSSATVWDARLDLLYPMKVLSLQRSKVFAGVRRTRYSGYFEYVGGNETFNVEGTQWGVGGGVEAAFSISPLVDMTFSVGADQYFKGELYGHGSYYRPNGDDVDPTGNYTWKDADAAANQPVFETRFLVGLAYRF
jgi:hypothetical protein